MSSKHGLKDVSVEEEDKVIAWCFCGTGFIPSAFDMHMEEISKSGPFIVVNTYSDMGQTLSDRIVGIAASKAGIKQLIRRDQHGYFAPSDYDVYGRVCSGFDIFGEDASRGEAPPVVPRTPTDWQAHFRNMKREEPIKG